MIVTLNIPERTCTVTRESGDPRLGNESALLCHVKRALHAQGHDVIKKRMYKDGHLVDDHQQYVRSRNVHKAGAFCVWHTSYAIEDAARTLRLDGTITLAVETLEVEG